MGLFARRKRGRQQKVAPASPINELAHAGSETEWIEHAKPLLWLVAWAIVAYAAFVNARAAPSLDFLVLGLVLDVLGPVGLANFIRARRERRYGMAAICATLTAFGLTWSLFSALNTGAHGTFGAERQQKHAAGQQVSLQADTKAAELALAAAGMPRATVAVNADISAILDDPRSDGCTEVNGKFTKAECPKLGPLRKELGQAKARDDARKRLDDLKAKAAVSRPVAEVEPAVEFAVRFARMAGYSIEPDTIRLSRAILYTIVLEILKTCVIAWVAWLTPRSSPSNMPPIAFSGAPDGLEAPARIRQPPKQGATPEPSEWLLQALLSDSDLPEGIERRNGGLQGSYVALAAVWRVSPAKAQRLGRAWQASGTFVVRSTPRGTWIGLPRAQLRAV